MDEPREVRNEDGTVPKWARRVTDTFVDATGIRDAKYRELVESIEAAEKATNGVFSSKSAGGILDMNAYREMEEEDRIAMGIEQARRNAEAAQLAKLRAERDRIDEEAARARIKAATEASLAAAPRDKKKADAAGAPFKLVKVVKKKPTPAKRTTEETETGDGDDAGGLRGLLGGYGSDDSADGVDVAPPPSSTRAPTNAREPPPPPQRIARPELPPAASPHHPSSPFRLGPLGRRASDDESPLERRRRWPSSGRTSTRRRRRRRPPSRRG